MYLNCAKNTLLIVFLFLELHSFSQPVGYYDGTEGKAGEELKAALHQIINNHVDFSYYFAKEIINYSDADPENENNVILFYTQESRNSSLYGTGGDDINREHVWAKSHGYFSGERPMDGDAFNLHPADASVNNDRGNKDFDNIQPGGNQHPEALYCYYTDSTWEPGPITKGQVARTLFYMATRYEGTNQEIDLEVVPHNNTFPNPEHGNLIALLEWNDQYPPTEFERRRNERIFRIQQNRNPFIDNPDFANYIWKNELPSGPVFDKFEMVPDKPSPGESVEISIELNANSSIPDSIILFWGNSFDPKGNHSEMLPTQTVYSTTIPLPDYLPGEMVYFRIEITENQIKRYIDANYLLPKPKESLTITPVSEVQGTGNQTPLMGQMVTVTGRVTANFDGSFYIQNDNNYRDGICIYGSLQTGKIGDSLVITGEVDEYANLTELVNISYLYNFDDNKKFEPIEISITDINEEYEGMLVQINDIEFEKQGTTIPNENRTYTFSNNNGNSVIFSKRESRLVGNKIPSGKIDLVGIVGQYQEGYQILPRDMNDFLINTYNSVHFTDDMPLSIYPNPTRSVLKIKTSKEIEFVKILDLTGKKMSFINGDSKEVSVEGIPPGIYVITISLSSGEIIHNKFMKYN